MGLLIRFETVSGFAVPGPFFAVTVFAFAVTVFAVTVFAVTVFAFAVALPFSAVRQSRVFALEAYQTPFSV